MLIAIRKSDSKLIKDLQTGDIKIEWIVTQFGGTAGDYDLVRVPESLWSDALRCDTDLSSYNPGTETWTFVPLVPTVYTLAWDSNQVPADGTSTGTLTVTKKKGAAVVPDTDHITFTPQWPIRINKVAGDMVAGVITVTVTSQLDIRGVVQITVAGSADTKRTQVEFA